MTSLKINNWPALLLRSINGIKWPVNHKFKVYHQKLCGYKCYLSLSEPWPDHWLFWQAQMHFLLQLWWELTMWWLWFSFLQLSRIFIERDILTWKNINNPILQFSRNVDQIWRKKCFLFRVEKNLTRKNF